MIIHDKTIVNYTRSLLLEESQLQCTDLHPILVVIMGKAYYVFIYQIIYIICTRDETVWDEIRWKDNDTSKLKWY